MRSIVDRAIFPVLTAVLLLSVCGCHSDVHYQNQAIERARKFLLEKATDLDWQQREFVRYSDPAILHSPIIGAPGVGSATQLRSEKRQICVTWQIPGKEGVYMVFGVSNGRMDYWTPERLLRKNFILRRAPLAEAAKIAGTYARNNLFHQLTPTQMNQIRFTSPALLITNFDITVRKPADPVEKAAFEEALAKKLQLTLAWDLKNGDSAFFCGRGNPDLSSWQIERAGIISNSELASRTIRTVMTPAQKLDVLPDLTGSNSIGCQCEYSEKCIEEGLCRNPVKQ